MGDHGEKLHLQPIRVFGGGAGGTLSFIQVGTVKRLTALLGDGQHKQAVGIAEMLPAREAEANRTENMPVNIQGKIRGCLTAGSRVAKLNEVRIDFRERF